MAEAKVGGEHQFLFLSGKSRIRPGPAPNYGRQYRSPARVVLGEVLGPPRPSNLLNHSSLPRTVLFIFGTRPEAIQAEPPGPAPRRFPDLYTSRSASPAQHRQMLDQVLAAFRIAPDFDLNVMSPAQTLVQSTSRILAPLRPVFAQLSPTSPWSRATPPPLCAEPSPRSTAESRSRTSKPACAPAISSNRSPKNSTASSPATSPRSTSPRPRRPRRISQREGVSQGIAVTGNTGIDALLYVCEGLAPVTAVPGKRLILVTAHRREEFGPGEQICEALLVLAARPVVDMVYPVLPNPSVQ